MPSLKIFRCAFAAVACLLLSLSTFAQEYTFEQAKNALRKSVYHDQFNQAQGTLYCGCQWQWAGKTGGRVDLASCGYQVRKNKTRAERTEWEHVVPAWVMGHQRQCWQNGGRNNCRDTDPVFKYMEGDLFNLTIAIGEVNGDRSNYNYGMVNSKEPVYGQCTSKVDFKQRVFEPRNEVKGQVARIYFYMFDRYNLNMSRQQQQLLMAWDKMYPVNQWEIERNKRISALTGHSNLFVTGERKWKLGHKNSGDGIKAISGK